MNEKKKLTISDDKLLFGVCGGLAEYFDIDVTIVRFIMALLCACNGIGIFLYIIGIFIMPKD